MLAFRAISKKTCFWKMGIAGIKWWSCLSTRPSFSVNINEEAILKVSFKNIEWFQRETIICQTIIRPNSFCYNMSDRFLCAVIISQTGCYNMSDTFYANNLLIYCAVIYQTTGNYLILPVVIQRCSHLMCPPCPGTGSFWTR